LLKLKPSATQTSSTSNSTVHLNLAIPSLL
jgi:hypothetical protein